MVPPSPDKEDNDPRKQVHGKTIGSSNFDLLASTASELEKMGLDDDANTENEKMGKDLKAAAGEKTTAATAESDKAEAPKGSNFTPKAIMMNVKAAAVGLLFTTPAHQDLMEKREHESEPLSDDFNALLPHVPSLKPKSTANGAGSTDNDEETTATAEAAAKVSPAKDPAATEPTATAESSKAVAEESPAKDLTATDPTKDSAKVNNEKTTATAESSKAAAPAGLTDNNEETIAEKEESTSKEMTKEGEKTEAETKADIVEEKEDSTKDEEEVANPPEESPAKEITSKENTAAEEESTPEETIAEDEKAAPPEEDSTTKDPTKDNIDQTTATAKSSTDKKEATATAKPSTDDTKSKSSDANKKEKATARARKFKVGQEVYAKYTNGFFYYGKITRIKGTPAEPKYDILFNDGDKAFFVPMEHVFTKKEGKKAEKARKLREEEKQAKKQAEVAKKEAAKRKREETIRKKKEAEKKKKEEEDKKKKEELEERNKNKAALKRKMQENKKKEQDQAAKNNEQAKKDQAAKKKALQRQAEMLATFKRTKKRGAEQLGDDDDDDDDDPPAPARKKTRLSSGASTRVKTVIQDSDDDSDGFDDDLDDLFVDDEEDEDDDMQVERETKKAKKSGSGSEKKTPKKPKRLAATFPKGEENQIDCHVRERVRGLKNPMLTTQIMSTPLTKSDWYKRPDPMTSQAKAREMNESHFPDVHFGCYCYTEQNPNANGRKLSTAGGHFSGRKIFHFWVPSKQSKQNFKPMIEALKRSSDVEIKLYAKFDNWYKGVFGSFPPVLDPANTKRVEKVVEPNFED